MRWWISLSLMLYAGVQLLGQDGKAVVVGKIRDAETGEELGRATVVAIARDTVGAYADLRGNVRLQLAPGTYRLRVSLVGYAAAERTLTVKAGDTLRLEVRLYPQVRQMEGVVVEARRDRQSWESALAERRSATGVVEVIAAEQMRASADADAGQVLQRISSVAVQEGKYVYVRGTNERYSTVLLNGLPVAMTEPDRRGLALELFPVEVLEQVVVAKSSTSDIPVATGGVVELRTMDIPDRSFVQLQLGSPYVAGLSFRKGAYQHYPAGASDWLGWDSQWRRLPEGMPSSRQEMNELLRAVWNPYDTTGARQRWVALGRAFNDRLWGRETTTVALLPNLGLAAGWRLPLGSGSEWGGVGTLTYERGASASEVSWRGLLADRSLLFEHSGLESSRSVNLAALLNTGVQFGSGHRLQLRNLFSRSLTDRFLFLQGADRGYQFLDLRHYVYHLTQYQLWSSQLSGSHAWDGYALEWGLSGSQARQQQPDYRRLCYQRQSSDTTEPFIAEIPATQQGDGTRAGRVFMDLLEKATAAQLRGRLPLPMGTVRIGFAWDRRIRDFRARSFTLIQARGGAREIDFTLPPEELLRAENFREDGLGISEDTKRSDSYSATEEIWATYVTGEFPLQLGSLPARVSVGLRTELARQELSSYHINDQPLRESQRWLDWLPTVTLLVQVTPQLQLRGAFFRSVTRPTFRERAPFAFFDVTQQSLFQGNPLLEPARAWNGELRGEWYFSPGEFLSLGGFVKRITKAIEETIFPQQSELTRTVANAVEPARLLGAELEFRKRLSMLGAVGQQLVLFGNASLVYGRVGVRSGGLIVERQLWGQAPYSLNLGLLWQTPFGGELSFVWNRIGRRIVEVAQPEQYSFPDPHVYELPFDALDATYRQPLPGGVSLSLKAKNLLGQAVRWEQGGIEVYRQPRPRSLSLSIGYKLP